MYLHSDDFLSKFFNKFKFYEASAVRKIIRILEHCLIDKREMYRLHFISEEL